MKRRLLFAPMVLSAALLTFGGSQAPAEVSFSAGLEIRASSDFYAPLASHGSWVEVGSYGRCWHPASVEVGWRPYCAGSWEWTDCGWYWVSDEPWAWACYHYGSWIHDSAYGWVWVPGIEWAPAWVYWRVGPDYIGWAPCGPRGVVLAPSLFVFVGTSRFREPIRPSTVIVNNTTIINSTKTITNIRRETRTFDGTPQKVVINHGPGVDAIQKATRARLSPVPITQAARRTPIPSAMGHSTTQSGKDQHGVVSPPPTGRSQIPPAGNEGGYERAPDQAPPGHQAVPRPPAREFPPQQPAPGPAPDRGKGHDKDKNQP